MEIPSGYIFISRLAINYSRDYHLDDNSIASRVRSTFLRYQRYRSNTLKHANDRRFPSSCQTADVSANRDGSRDGTAFSARERLSLIAMTPGSLSRGKAFGRVAVLHVNHSRNHGSRLWREWDGKRSDCRWDRWPRGSGKKARPRPMAGRRAESTRNTKGTRENGATGRRGLRGLIQRGGEMHKEKGRARKEK